MNKMINGEIVEMTPEDVAAWQKSVDTLNAEPMPRNLLAEIDELTTKLARAEKLEATLIEKAVLTKTELDGEK